MKKQVLCTYSYRLCYVCIYEFSIPISGSSGKRKRSVKNVSDDEQYSDDENNIEWIEESSESEPELECDAWDNDCITISQQQRKNAVYGCNDN